ncbi:MAG TPA: RHS repeat-associated core domain-containing protein, partial [Bdellovibrionota bacterium]|nr:RHS repeat-associated core domain-containing protein [Bdellovibrionota bacterium]
EYGRAKTTTDPNGIVSEVFYDPFQRAYRNTVSVGGVIQNESATDFLGLCDQACTTAPEADGSWATLKLPKNQRIRSKASQYRLQPAANWPWTETWFNALGQAYLKKSASKDNNGIDRVVIAETQFEAGTGRPWKASPAYQEGTPTPASNLWSVTSYDHIGRAYQVQYPSPTGEPLIHSVSQTVDPALHRIKTTSFGPMNVPGQPLHSKESYADVEGRVRKVVEYVENPEGVVEAHSVSYAYDFLGNVIQMIDDQGRYTTSAAFDAFDQKRKTVDDDMGEWTYSYDDLGNLVEQQDAMGNRTQLEYDDLGRVIHKSLISPSQVESYNTYAYDVDPINHTPIGASVGEILRVSNQNAALHYTYDELGRPTLVEQWIGSGNGIDNKIETGFIYNDAAPTLDIVYDAGSYRPEIVTYQFQERTGRLLGITSDLPGSNVLASNFVYDTLGKTQSLIHGNGLMSKFFYNLGDQQTLSRTRIDGPATLNSPKSNLLDYSYVEFDRNRNLINVIDDANGRDSRYVYDGLDRLKEADVQNLASGLSEIRNYEYDLMGRMTSMEGPYEPYGKPYAPVSVLPPPAPSPSPTPIVTPTPTPTPGGRGSGKGKIISGRMEKKWLLRIASWIADQILPSAQAITLQETLEASPNSEILANGQLCSQIKATVTDGSSLRVPIEGVNVNFSVSPTTGATWKTGCGSGSTLPISPVVPTNSQGVAIVYLHSTAAATKNVTGANATFNFSKTVPVSFVNITAPTNLTASGAGQTQIHLSWGPSTGVSGIAGYKIYRNGGATSVATVDLAATSYLDTGLSAGTTFTYAVKAYQSATTSNPSNTASAMTLPPTSLAMSYSGPGPVHALKSDGVYRHEYDLNGNLIATYDTRTVPETRIERLEYTPANMLERVTDVSGYSTEYEYDADNVRVRKVVKDAGGNIVEDRRFFGTTEMINGRKTRKYGIAQRDMDTGQVSFIHTDHLRSVVLVSDEQGNPVTRNEYYEFGAQKNPASEPVEDSFTGMKLDKATDYTATDRLHFNAREMAPKRFAFTTADTIIPRLTDPQSLNRYAYANNPINRIDPSGHNDIDLWAYYYGSPYDDTYFGGPLGPGMGSGGSYFGSDPFSGGYGGYDPGYRDSSGTYWTSPEAYNQAMQRSAVAARIAQIGEQIMRDPYFASTAFLNSSVPVMNALPAPSSPEITDERQVAEVRAFTGNDLNTTVWITEYINDNVTWRDSYDISPEMRSDDFNSALREKVGERLSSTLARLAESELKSAIKKGGQDILKDRIRNYAPDRLKDAEKTLRGLKAVDVTNSAIERKWEKSLTSFVSMVCPPCAKLLGRSFFVYHEAWEPSSKGVAATFETVFRNSPGSRYYDPVGPMELEK